MAMPDSTFARPRTDALLRITQAIETATTLDELLLLGLNELTQLFDVAQGCVVLLAENGTVGVIAQEYPPQITPPVSLPIAESDMLRRVISERRTLHIYEPDTIDAFLQAYSIRSALLVPLISQDQPIGVLSLNAADASHRFTEEDEALARILAGPLAAAIIASRTREAAEMRSEELDTLNEIASTVTSTLDEHEVYKLVVQKLNTYFNVDAGSILLLDEATGDLVFVMTIEGNEERLAGLRVPMGQGVAGYVAQTGKSVIVHDVEKDARFYRKISEQVGYVTRSILCVPMVAKGRVIGVIELLNKLNGDFTPEDAERMTGMAAFIGVAIENARLFQQVADGRDRLAAILNSTAEGIVMTDMHGAILSVNPMAAKLFGASESELLGQLLDSLLADLHSRAHEVITRSWGQNDSEQADTSFVEIELGGARRRFFRYLRLPVRDTNGEMYAQLAVFHDITQERELAQLRDDYTGMLVHDLRAPLTSIMNGIIMLQRGLGGPVNDQQRELLSIAHLGSQTMLELINNLLDISKMEQGRMELEIEPLVPYNLFDEAAERLEGLALNRRVVIEQMLAVGLPLIDADKDKIVRVLQNLLDNAIKFSPSEGAVTMGAHYFAPDTPLPPDVPIHPPLTEGSWLTLWIQDRGPGIPAAYHERIFEKFGQVRGRKVRGTGLGLTFCKLAVEAHHGHIWLESKEGVGSIFAFALPLNRQQ
jgi:PAS domain S-box-containing protein